MSYGERIGLATMADISDIKAHLLRTTSKNYMRLENTRKANDIIANATAMLLIFQHYNLYMQVPTGKKLRRSGRRLRPVIPRNISASAKD
jgi:hypothetical protein